MSTQNYNYYGKTGMEGSESILRGPPKLPLPNMSIGQYVLNKLRANLSNTFQIDVENGRQITNKDLLEMSVKLACVLQKRGVSVGDRICISAENHLHWFVPACATLFAGAVFAPLNPAYTEWELKNMLNISKPKVVFVSRCTERLFTKVASDLPWSIEVIELDDKAYDIRMPTLKKILEENDSIADPYDYKPVEIGSLEKQPAVLLCSSGTTGFPKAVTLSHRNLMFFLIIAPTPDTLDYRRGDRPLIFLPFFHGYAFGIMLLCLVTGATGLVMRSFHMDAFLTAVQKYKVTHVCVVPPILVLLAKHPSADNYDFSSVRELVCAAAPVSKDVIQKVGNRLKVPVLRNAYGMTELSILVCVCDRSNDGNGTAGYLAPGILCKVVDQLTHETLRMGQVGELCFKGDLVMLGYYGNAEATKQTIDKDGWLHSGDLGYYDERGRIFISGRVKELIKYKAFQVSPSELESILLSHPGVKDAAVVGKPDELSGELPMAFVVKQPASSVTTEEIVKYVNEKVSPQKWLRGGVKYIYEIPKTASGKIIRRELAKLTTKL